MKYHLTNHDIQIIKEIAGRSITRIEAGIRFNMEDDTKPESVNILIVSDTGDWDETDLADHISLNELKKYGFDLDKNGEAELDFYLYNKDELVTNMSASFDTAGLVAAYNGGRSWERIRGDV